MARPKNDGKGRIGGRGKGTPNKVTTDLKEWVTMILEGGKDKFEQAMDSLEPQEYVRVFTGLLNFVLPKQAPINPESLIEKEKIMLQDFVLSLPDAMVERVAKRLNELSDENKARE